MHIPVAHLPSVRLRPYTVDDADVAFAIFAAHAEGAKKKGYLSFRSALLEPDSLMLAAEECARVVAVGGLQFVDDGWRAVIHTDGVSPAHQKRGIGTALVMARLASVEDHFGCEVVTLVATELSRGFYARFGFAQCGEPEFDPVWGFELVPMELPFSAELRSYARDWLSRSGIASEPARRGHDLTVD